jgi:hypothetical protein
MGFQPVQRSQPHNGISGPKPLKVPQGRYIPAQGDRREPWVTNTPTQQAPAGRYSKRAERRTGRPGCRKGSYTAPTGLHYCGQRWIPRVRFSHAWAKIHRPYGTPTPAERCSPSPIHPSHFILINPPLWPVSPPSPHPRPTGLQPGPLGPLKPTSSTLPCNAP